MYGNGDYAYSAAQLAKHVGNKEIKDALIALEQTSVVTFFAWRCKYHFWACVRYKDERCLYDAGATLAYICINGDERLPTRKQDRAKANLEFVVYKEVKASAYDEESQDHVAPANDALKKAIEALESVHANWRYYEE